MLAIDAGFVSNWLALTPNQDSNFSPLAPRVCRFGASTSLFLNVGFCFRCTDAASVFSSVGAASVFISVGNSTEQCQVREVFCHYLISCTNVSILNLLALSAPSKKK